MKILILSSCFLRGKVLAAGELHDLSPADALDVISAGRARKASAADEPKPAPVEAEKPAPAEPVKKTGKKGLAHA